MGAPVQTYLCIVNNFLKFTMELLFFFCLCSIFGVYGQIKDNEQTLIYHRDEAHKINYYCQFGTVEEIHKGGATEMECFNRNKGIVHFVSGDIPTYPYIAYGAPVGFVLKCADVTGITLHSCSRFVYTNCSYMCSMENATREMTCELRRNENIVTAEWSLSDPCTKASNEDAGKLTTQESSAGHMISDNSENVIIAVAISVVGVVVVAAVIIYMVLRRRRKRNKYSTSVANEPVPREQHTDVPATKSSSGHPMPVMRTPPSKPKIPGPKCPETEQSHLLEASGGEDNEQKEIEPLDDWSLMDSDLQSLDPKLGFVVFSKDQQKYVQLSGHPSQCNVTISLFSHQPGSYRRKLGGELEVIQGRSREQALVGYMEEHYEELGFQTVNEIKLLEKKYENKIDDKVSDFFLQKLAECGITVGSIVKYFHTHGNDGAIRVILEVHKGCRFCDKFRV